MDIKRRDVLMAAPLVLSSSVRGANDRPSFGMIGTGLRGRWLHGAFQRLGARCVALCDVYEPNLAAGLKEASTAVCLEAP